MVRMDATNASRSAYDGRADSRRPTLRITTEQRCATSGGVQGGEAATSGEEQRGPQLSGGRSETAGREVTDRSQSDARGQ